MAAYNKSILCKEIAGCSNKVRLILRQLFCTTKKNIFMAKANKSLKKGDKVQWQTSQGKTSGTVKKKLTSPTKIKSHEVAASNKNPEYLVETEKTKKIAAHKPEALKKQTK